jgi:CheY-like chemotaxis protein/two-component sensor histidine kinase
VELVGTALDISDLKHGEERLRDADRRKDEFIAMLAHELRNPLAAIGIAGEILGRSELPDERTRFAASVVARQMDQLQRLVDDLLDVARAMHGKLVLERRPVELRALARAVADQPNRSRVGMRIDGEPAWARGDPARLRQVIDNLLDNAVKYGGRHIVIATRSAADWAEISVQDDGIGIDAGFLPQLFKPFVQGEQPLERPQGGLGLGLALVDRIVALHGGAISAHGEGAGLGSTFTVRLPRAETPQAVAPGAAGPQATRRRVLVIEDEPDARDALRLLLEMDGHDVQLAADGTEGLSMLAGWRPEVALVDVGLPGLDGYEVARRARSLGMDGRLVALTGYGQTRDRERARAAGFDLHLVKPVSYDDLKRAFEL